MKQAISLVYRICNRGHRELIDTLVDHGDWVFYNDWNGNPVRKKLSVIGHIVRETIRDVEFSKSGFSSKPFDKIKRLSDEAWVCYVGEYPELFEDFKN